MRKQVLLACETIRDEIELVKEKTGIEMETIWMDNTLHAYPEKLREALQAKIDELADVEEILMAYGNCGNGLLGLGSAHSRLIIPKYADCIEMLLNKKENLERVRTNTYFLTRGWLKGEKNLRWELDYNKERYGEKRAKKITQALYRHYKYLMLIDTGAYPVEAEMETVEGLAEELSLESLINSGDVTPLEKLLKGHWDNHFCIIEPGKKTELESFDMII